MSTVKITKEQSGAWTPFKSTNFTLQSLLPLFLLIGAALNFPEDVTTSLFAFIGATFAAGLGFWGTIREFFKDGFKLVWNSNVATYLVAVLAAIVPWVASYDIAPVLQNLVDAVLTGNFNLIFTALFAVGNILYKLITDKPWITPDRPIKI
jgi:hypothetical protein